MLNLKTQINQFLLYFKKIWLSHKEAWQAGESLHECILTNCALESYHRGLNAVLKTLPSPIYLIITLYFISFFERKFIGHH